MPGKAPMKEKHSGKNTILQPFTLASLISARQVSKFFSRSFTDLICVRSCMYGCISRQCPCVYAHTPMPNMCTCPWTVYQHVYACTTPTRQLGACAAVVAIVRLLNGY